MTVFGQSGTTAEYNPKRKRKSRGSSAKRRAKRDEAKELSIAYQDGTVRLTLFPLSNQAQRKRKLPELTYNNHELRKIPFVLAKELFKQEDRLKTFDSLTSFQNFVMESETKAAKDKLLRLVNQRDYAEAEAREKLLQEYFLESIVDNLLDRAVAGRLIDDGRYADVYIRSKVSQGIGKSKIQTDLSRLGINCDDLNGWPDEYFDYDEEERAFTLASHKLFSEPHRYDKIVRFLYTKGYAFEVAKQVARRIVRERD